MSKHDWKPGDVAVLANDRIAVVTPNGNFAYGDEPLEWAKPDSLNARTARPLVVLDPDDEATVNRVQDALADAHSDNRVGVLLDWLSVQAALRSLVAPPRPEVYSHIVATECNGITTSICGKVWQRDTNVTVVGNCPNCRELTERWVA